MALRAKFLGVEKRQYTNAKTGEMGVEYNLSLHDGKGVRKLRVPVELYRELESLPVMSDVSVRVGFVSGRFNDYVAVTGLDAASAVAK